MAMDVNHETALLKAILDQDLDQLTEVEWYDKDLPIQLGENDKFVSSVMVASFYGYAECLKKLLENVKLFDLNTTYKRSLLLAAGCGHTECVRLLSRQALFDKYSLMKHEGLNDIIMAIDKLDFDLVQNLLSRNASSMWVQGIEGGNILTLLILYGCPTDCLLSMINNGASVNQRDRHGFTPLMMSVIAGRIECVQFFLQMDANVNLHDKTDQNLFKDSWFYDDHRKRSKIDNFGDSKTALMYAVNMKNIEFVVLLLEHGAEVNDFDEEGFSALMHAACVGNSECVKSIVNSSSSVNINKVDNQKRSALIHAAYAGDTASVKLLLKAKADRFQKDESQRTAFLAGVISRNFDCAVTLLKFSTEIDTKDVERKNSLMYAAESGNVKLLELLMSRYTIPKHTKKPECSMKALNTATLFYALNSDSIECAEVLIKNGCDLSCRNSDGQSLLTFACEKNDTDFVKFLVKSGCDVNYRSLNGKTPLMLVCGHGNTELFHFLVKCGANIKAIVKETKTSVLMYALRGHLDCVEFLLKNGVKVDFANNENETPLMLACQIGRPDCVRLLVKYGANINAVGKYRESVLVYAVEGRNIDCFQSILDAGANVDVLSQFKRTVFYSVIGVKNPEFLKALINHGQIFEGRKLKKVHRRSFASHRFWYCSQPMMITLMQNRIFEWAWYPESPLRNTFAAVMSGISPGVFSVHCDIYSFDSYDTKQKLFKNSRDISPLLAAFLGIYPGVVRFLLANLYFTEEDYRVLLSNIEFREAVKTMGYMPDLIPIYEQITSQPWSLQTLSFLSISTSVALSGSDLSRADQVDSLLIPDKFKTRLKFQNTLSSLCPSMWKYIGSPPGYTEKQDFLSLTQPVWPYPQDLINCQKQSCECGGLGFVIKDYENSC